MTKKGQTHGMKANDLVEEMAKYSKRQPDIVLMNNKKIPKSILESYKKQGEFPIENDTKGKKYKVISASLISDIPAQKDKGDDLIRSLLRHDSVKVSKILYYKAFKKRFPFI